MTHLMPTLPYAEKALAPHLSEETIQFHYGKHLQTYIDNLNRLIAGTEFEDKEVEEIIKTADGGIFNNAAQIWNHTFYFETLTPRPTPIGGELRRLLERDFQSTEHFREAMRNATLGLFGSGWVWLVKDAEGKLSIRSTSNAGNPLREGMTALLTIDVWEHAYYIDYRNSRANYFDALWNIIDWQKVEGRLGASLF